MCFVFFEFVLMYFRMYIRHFCVQSFSVLARLACLPACLRERTRSFCRSVFFFLPCNAVVVVHAHNSADYEKVL